MSKFFLICLFFLVSCGYKFQEASVLSVEVPYVEGDFEGALTGEIVAELSSHGFICENRGGDKKLLIRILEQQDMQIGYMHDRNDDGSYRKNILPTEGRENIKAECVLKDSNDHILFGPFIAAAETEFDFIEQNSPSDLSFVNNSGQRISVLQFSLGQLEARESAKEAAKASLYRKLAQKIVERVEWDYGRK